MSSSPVVLVGMPRSGSTLFTRLLNESADLFMVNDFYFLQHVDAENGFDKVLDEKLAIDLAKDLVDRIRARVERPDSPPIECGLQMSSQQEQELISFALAQAAKEGQTWNSLLQAIMLKAGSLLGKSRWGYNTPQDHLHLDRLFEAFPDLTVIFLLRDPRDTIRSYKNVTENGYHAPNRYHPAVQALMWRTAVRRYLHEHEQKRKVMMVRYEDVVEDTNTTFQKIASFADIDIPAIDLSTFGNNSSFAEKKKYYQLCETEISVCESVASQEMKTLDYETSGSRVHIKEVGYLMFITLRLLSFYLTKSISSQDSRKRLVNSLQNILQKKANLTQFD